MSLKRSRKSYRVFLQKAISARSRELPVNLRAAYAARSAGEVTPGPSLDPYLNDVRSLGQVISEVVAVVSPTGKIGFREVR